MTKHVIPVKHPQPPKRNVGGRGKQREKPVK
jgi:hypothetical protein